MTMEAEPGVMQPQSRGAGGQRSWKRQDTVSLETREGIMPCQHLDSCLMTLVLDFWPPELGGNALRSEVRKLRIKATVLSLLKMKHSGPEGCRTVRECLSVVQPLS